MQSALDRRQAMLEMLSDRRYETVANIMHEFGVSRSTVISIENKKRDMTWNTFLSLMLLFTKNQATNILLNVLDIYTEEFNEFIKDR